MADIKISALNALLGADAAIGDYVPIVDVSVPETKRMTRTEFFKNIPACDFAGANVWNDAGDAIDQRMEGDTDANLFFLQGSTDRIGIGTATPTAKLQVNGSLATGAPVTVTTSYTVAATDVSIISNRGASNTMTLPAASTSTGRWLYFLTYTAFTVVSASSNVVQKTGGAATAAILPATAGAWAWLQSNGTNWQIMAAGT